MSRAARLLPLAFGLLLVLAGPAHAEQVQLRGRVVSVREGQAYLELERPVRVKIGAKVELLKEGRATTAVIAVSTKWLVVRVPEGLELAKGDVFKLSASVTPAPGRAEGEEEEEGQEPTRAPVQLNRRPLSASQYQKSGTPHFEKVAFHHLSLPEAGSDMARKGETAPPKGEGGRPGPGSAPPPRGEGRPTAAAGEEQAPGELGPPANEVRGELELGYDSLDDDDAGIHRITPYGRLNFEVRRLGGSDRAHLLFYGSLRRPFDANVKDWTGHHEETAIARISAAVLEIEALPESQVQGFSDRIELAVGRSTVPTMVQTGLVDGIRLGLRFGPAVLFGFGGAGVSPNPQRADYDSVVYGGGLRLAQSIAHVGGYHASLGIAQERFRGEGERDWVEARAGVRLGSFGIDCTFVIDFFDQLRDKRRTYPSFLGGAAYWQLNSVIRLEAGYREVRPAYQADLVSRARLNRDIPDPAITAAFAAAGDAPSDLDPIVAPFLERQRRYNGYGAVVLRLGSVTALMRITHLSGGNTRETYGLYASLTKDHLFTNDRFTLEGSYFHREKGGSIRRSSADMFWQARYLWFGESVEWGLAFYYRNTIPEELGDSRFGGRVNFDADLAEWLGLDLYGGLESRRLARGSGAVFMSGGSLSFRF